MSAVKPHVRLPRLTGPFISLGPLIQWAFCSARNWVLLPEGKKVPKAGMVLLFKRERKTRGGAGDTAFIGKTPESRIEILSRKQGAPVSAKLSGSLKCKAYVSAP